MSDKQILFTASVGLFQDENDQCYLEVISAETTGSLLLKISQDSARQISLSENLSIDFIHTLQVRKEHNLIQ